MIPDPRYQMIPHLRFQIMRELFQVQDLSDYILFKVMHKMLLAERCKNGPYMRERVFGQKTDDCLVCIYSGLLLFKAIHVMKCKCK